MQRAHGHTVDIDIDGIPATITLAHNEAGQLTLIDARVGKHGSPLAGLFAAWSEAATAALRAGAPLERLLPPAERAPAIQPVLHTISDHAVPTHDAS